MPGGARRFSEPGMTDIPNVQPDSREATIMDAPDRMLRVREAFGIDSDMEVPAFSEADERVPDADRRSLRTRYAELVRKYHPDRNGGDRSHEKALTAVIEAYAKLKSAAAFA